MNWLLDLFDRLRTSLRARFAARAAIDAAEGDTVIAQADAEAREMAAAADAQALSEAATLAEARKRLDTDLNGVPIVAAPTAPAVPSPAPATSVLAAPSAANAAPANPQLTPPPTPGHLPN